MQFSRVAIAAVFFVIGALIVIPALMNSSPSSQAASATPTAVSPTPTKTRKTPTPHRPSHKPTRTPAPTHTPPQGPSTPPAPSVTPLVPLRVKIGDVLCPARTVLVTVENTGRQTEDYAITTDGSISVADRIPGNVTRRSTLHVKEDHTTTVSVTLHNVPVKTIDRHVNCMHKVTGKTLPHTGPDSALLYARIATGLAAMLTGVIIFWYGRLWPARKEKMFGDKEE